MHENFNKMKKLVRLLFLFLFCSMNAQTHEIGFFAGGTNYIGDVGLITESSPNPPLYGLLPAFGILYKWNKNPRLSYRFSLTGALIAANDGDSKEPGRNLRGYSFRNSIKEVSFGLEFNFFNFNLHDSETKITPYVHSGISYFRFNDGYSTPSKIVVGQKDIGAMAIPMSLGIKSNITPRFVLGAEIGTRYTFTDNLDGSNPSDESLPKFGNINNNDWYVFSGVTLTYTFGKKHCYCAE